MKISIYFSFLITIVLLSSGFVSAQTNKLITENSAGVIKIGMSAARARKRAKPLTVSKGVNVFEGDMLSRVMSGKTLVMTFIEYFGKITQIDVWDRTYQTADHVHVGMALSDLEKVYGPIKQIYMDEQDNYEFAVFSNQPKGVNLMVAVPGKGKDAGIYPENKDSAESFTTSKFNPGIYLKRIRLQATE